MARDIAWIAAVVGGIALILFLFSGTWPAAVTVESESMVPNMNVGDLIFVVEKDRYGEFRTWLEGQSAGYASFGDYGDVIVYRPNGADSVNPIIHRAMGWVEPGQQIPLFGNESVMYYYTAPSAGYVTMGDNNDIIDQATSMPGVGIIAPVREDWVVGKALIAIPLLGYLPLHIVEFGILIVMLILMQEWWSRRKGEPPAPDRKK